jgi:hypothetical protein
LMTAVPLARGLPVAPSRITRNTALAVKQPLTIGIAQFTPHFTSAITDGSDSCRSQWHPYEVDLPYLVS